MAQLGLPGFPVGCPVVGAKRPRRDIAGKAASDPLRTSGPKR
jgi:hypothetical protein